MAWTTPGTAVAGEVLEAAFWNEQVRDNQSFLYTPPMVQCKRATSLTYTSATNIAYDAENFDTDGMHDNSTNTSRITINTAGVYLFNLNVYMTIAGTTTSNQIQFRKNNATIDSDAQRVTDAANVIRSYTYIAKATVNDYFEVQLILNGTPGTIAVPETPAGYNLFSAVWIGKD